MERLKRLGDRERMNLRGDEADQQNVALNSPTTLHASGPSSPASVSRGRMSAYQRLEGSAEEENPTTTGLGLYNVAEDRSASLEMATGSPKSGQEGRPRSVQITSPPGGQYSGHSSSQTAYDPAASPDQCGGEDDDDITRHKTKTRSQSSLPTSSSPDHYDDTELLNTKHSMKTDSIRSMGSKFNCNDFHPYACPPTRSFYQGRWNWLAISIICIALFSTVFSGIFLAIGLKAPRWGKSVRTGGALAPSGADILTQVFAKLIELSFVTCFVTFLGQVLSRRAFNSASKGVTIADLTMRNWIMQPGSIITHYETVQYAALTFLGVLSLVVAVLAMLYSTAASALVAPQLKFGPWEDTILEASVKTQFANVAYSQQTCQAPIRVNYFDANYSLQNVGNTCLELEHAANGYHNYKQYLTHWDTQIKINNATAAFLDQKNRPPGFGLFNETIAVNASWIDVMDTAANSNKYGRVINNVTLAFPHSGIVSAGADPANGIIQPTDLNGLGIYNLRASVPSPYLNVLCANFAEEEYAHFVYGKMPNVTLNATRDFSNLSTWWYLNGINWTRFNEVPIGSNPLDEVFGWEKPESRPAFYKYPIDFNTVLNNSRPNYAHSDSIYLLGKGDPTEPDYFMCKIKAGLTPSCSTEYEATSTGGKLIAHCEDPDDKLQYSRSIPAIGPTTSFDWYDIGVEAVNSFALNAGVTDGAASNARMLTQFMLTSHRLNTALPSPAEALAVLLGCTLLMASQDSPVRHFWDFPTPSLSTPIRQPFNASLRAQQYASGGTAAYQKSFAVVLLAVFALNIFTTAYFLLNKGLVTDFSEPPNLFSLAVNSPPSVLLAGSCGAGPVREQFKVNWGIETEGRHLYITDREGRPGAAPDPGQDRTRGTSTFKAAYEMQRRGGTTTPTSQTPFAQRSAPLLKREKSTFDKHLSMLNQRRGFL